MLATNGNGTEWKNHFLEEKAKAIRTVLGEPEVDLWKLRSLAISEGGLVNGEFTRPLIPVPALSRSSLSR